jgi:Iap family predicted aminopeptidase
VGSRVIRFETDALVPTRHGIPAITIASVNEDGYVSPYHWPTDTPENIELGSVERGVAFASRMIELLDQRAAG